eukprot:1886782-Rhodomonas_salina.3
MKESENRDEVGYKIPLTDRESVTLRLVFSPFSQSKLSLKGSAHQHGVGRCSLAPLSPCRRQMRARKRMQVKAAALYDNAQQAPSRL